VGSLKKTELEHIRQLISARDLRGALACLNAEIKAHPGEPNLLAELGIVHCFRGCEAEAFELLPLAAQGERGSVLVQMLADHLQCRLLLNKKDFDAAKRLELLKPFNASPDPKVGTRISACLIVKNEAENLARCLKSLGSFIDEIVVVDTGSTDTTVNIASGYGAVLGEFEWNDDFSAARNHALSLATGDWVLWIDADEEVDPASLSAIRRAIVRPQFGGYDIEIVNYVDEREKGDTFNHCPTRLFRRLPGVQFTGRIHEQVTPSLQDQGRLWARLDGARIFHYGYRPAEMKKKQKMERTLSLLEREVREDRLNGFQWFNLANAYLVAGKLSECENAGIQAVSLMPDKAPYGAHAYAILVQSSTGLGNLDAAIASGQEAVSRGFGTIAVLFEMSQALLMANRPQEALELSDQVMTMGWEEGAPGDRGIFTHKRLIVRGQILAVLGRLEEALECLDEALQVDPDFCAAIYSRGAVLERMGRLTDAVQSYSRAAQDEKNYTLSMKGCGRAFAAIGKPLEAADAFRKAWENSPSDLSSWVGWTSACEASGDVKAVLDAYEAFAAVNIPSAAILVNWGRALEAAGDPDRALQCFADAIKQDPAFGNAYFNCGDLLYRCGLSGEAVHLYEAGLQIDPSNADGWFTFGNALAKTGFTDRAVTAFHAALERNPLHQAAMHNLSVLTQQVAA
jgi:tetratricopeptide (TPR) repeat protein